MNFSKNTTCRACGASRDEIQGNGQMPTVDKFLEGVDVEETVAQKFRAMPASTQKQVILRGTLRDARNPTAVLKSRLNQIDPWSGGGGKGGDKGGWGGGMSGWMGGFGAMYGSSPAKGERENNDWWCPCGELNFAKNTDCRACGTPRDLSKGKGAMPTAQSFLGGKDVEDSVAQKFMGMPPELQEKVISKGTLNDARNPTAVLKSRMNQVQQDHWGDMYSSGGMDPWSMMASMGGGWGSWGGGGGSKQGNVKADSNDWWCDCGEMNFAKNANCRACGASREDSSGNMPTVEKFLEGIEVEDWLAQKFLEMPPELQKEVITRGGLKDARNPSAVLKSRMSQVGGGGGWDDKGKGKGMMKGKGKSKGFSPYGAGYW